MTAFSQRIRALLSVLNQRHHQFAITQGERFVRSLERRIGRQSAVGDAAFFDCGQFPWIAELEANWQVIRRELDGVLQSVQALPNFQDISADQLSITQDNRWKTYFFYGYGFKAKQNCDRCPETTRLIEQIPAMKTAFFSILLPHKQIGEHRGPYKGLLRYHLGLKVPQPDACRLRVGQQTRHWQEGCSLVFDDTFPHAAWNDSDEIRVVLFVDFVRPMRFPDAVLNRLMIQLIAWSPYVQSGKERVREWEARSTSAAAPVR
ncbi:aspartyl/asparaginyl beta-hydroxylase domain-containing protein [Romeria aff. gracilis LEGE 07310]|uniref:Aspartyl/asparaginyl beta-hydroxylase domain-containing protein n=1 Tax=Vasconcelosia minhoensis LEGE 07310 TaxID=915328 RepID=A0A8J7ART2_9CYAN|nr:aspartyl/asparaginyl beta-hydroxylase domain-containing protein [Romeria gracilis]MBE9079411.1 aspartyl/asparaginyl beta-hydroxylase domain-containing protein [Romeria aff. gracilis LEGE 07310]